MGAVTGATPLSTSPHCHTAVSRAGPAGRLAPAGPTHSARAWEPAGCSQTSFPCSNSTNPSVEWPREAIETIASPARPASCTSALASLRRTFARNTNMPRRLSVGARMSRLQTSRKPSPPSRTPMKLASMRPLGEHQAARRAWSEPSSAKSWVIWPCRKRAASSPCTRIAPRWGRGATPFKAVEVVSVMGELSCPVSFAEVAGLCVGC